MKTKKILTALILTLGVGSVFGQTETGKIWVTIPEIAKVDLKNESGRISSGNADFQKMISDLEITSVEKAVPSSKNRELQNLYEISCNCDENELLGRTAKMNELFSAPEFGPKYETLYDPNDYSVVFANDYALNLINAKGAWDITKGDSSVIIAVSDQNFSVNHEELIGKIHNYDPTNYANPYHGTAVAILAAGKTENGTGKSSIGFNCELALYRMNYNDLLTASYSGARVLNVSWTSGCFASSYVQMIVDEIYLNGTIIVAAAGNGPTCGGPSNLVYPSACNHVISVSSIGPNNNHQRIMGNLSSTHQHNATVDLTSPGYDVALSVAPGWYLTGNGTSFATPIVSGLIGLLLSVDPCLSYEQVETILKTTAVNIDALNPLYAGLLGAGRINAAAAVALAKTYNACGGNDDGNNGHGNDEDGDDESNPGQGGGNSDDNGNNGGNGGNGGNGTNGTNGSGNTGVIINGKGEKVTTGNTSHTSSMSLQESDESAMVDRFESDSKLIKSKELTQRNSPIVLEDNEYVYENSAFVRVMIENETGNQDENSVKIYPNPINGSQSLNIESSSEMNSCILTNIKGEVVRQIELTDATRMIEMNNLPDGIYYLTFNFKQGDKKTEKLVVVN